MRREDAKRLIEGTFDDAFDADRFRNFAKNLLNDLDESKAFEYHGNYIRDAFRDSIRQYQRLGQYTDPEGQALDVLAIELKRESSLERARTMQRNFVAWYLNHRDQKDAALVAYFTPGAEDWRFSFVRMNYATEKGDDGKIKVKKELTPARRYSFLVGKNEPNHTPQQQLFPILLDDRHNPTLAQIEDAFSIEKVTKEFFLKYKELFLLLKEALDKILKRDFKIKQEFERKQIDTVNFAKKLLGQIVFLYFLQKKGWLGISKDEKGNFKEWGFGPKHFLQKLFKKEIVSYRNFFNDILEPLFYEALAIQRENDYYSRFNCKIPFLNGGLFEPIGGYDWQQTDILIDDAIFQQIFETFDLFNFTVREDEPLEKEVAVDPEMLGKVFENLLEVKDRKSKGAYYTPREIVHYMCQESLINYLDTTLNTRESPVVPQKPVQKKLFGKEEPEQLPLTTEIYKPIVPREDIEFFIRLGEQAIEHDRRVEAEGRETRDYQYEMPESIRRHAGEIDAALADIKICDPAIGSGVFPVGMMQEIVKARLILNTYLPPLPSPLTKGGTEGGLERTAYNFKRHCIQENLYGVDIDPGAVDIAKLRLWLSLVVDEEDYYTIKPLPNLDYKIVCRNSLLGVEKDLFNQNLFAELETLKPKYFEATHPGRKRELKRQIDALIRQITHNDTHFDFEVYFSEVFHHKGAHSTDSGQGFDVVIGNPPYVRQENIKEYKPLLKGIYQCYTGVADIYVYFFERGFQILRKNGSLTFITSNKYMRAGYGEKLRRFLSGNAAIRQLIDFGDAPVFEATSYPSIILLQKTAPNQNQVKALSWQRETPVSEFESVVHKNSFLIAQKDLTADGWRIESPAVLRLLEKLRNAGQPLGEYVQGRFYYGIKTGLNEAFVVDRATRDRLIAEHPSSAEVLKPFLRGRDVKRWQVNFSERYLIKIESSENKTHFWSNKEPKEAERIFAKTYPAIYSHLMQFREKLIKRDDQGKYFWELRSCKYWQEFEQPKIVYPNICKRNEFAWDDQEFYTNQKAFIIPRATKFLLGVLNSTVIYWLFSKLLAKLQHDFYEPSSIFMKDFPIPVDCDIQSVESVVIKILNKKNENSNADVTALECEIDQLIYRLYGLNKEQIRIITEKD